MTRSVLQLFLVIIAASILSAHAEEFIAQKTLPANYPQLQDWFYTVFRIEVTKGSSLGTNAKRPSVEYKIIEVLRPGRFPPRQSKIDAEWINDPPGGEQWNAHKLAGTFDQWESIEITSPPAGTKLITLGSFDSPSEKEALIGNNSFADTPENRATVMANAASRPFLDWLTETAFWLTFIFPAAGFMCLFYSPKLGAFLAMLSWPSYLLYDSQVPVTSNIRLDALLAYPALGIASLIAAAGFALWVRAEGRKG
ncbi:MAG: hypothetical protein Q7V00_13180 [Sulfurimicrobium sp.]|nr:hypothetical protein [Sulfurimicrobium sp.]MDP1705848.1 hypothetical protein [Sulfurimicrobium sp.]MDP2197901.1 hypothetical protein [Sulfurimicrobium sp.]MDP3687447.1 hypothetical protein [Sulfurimicrobium sp.]